MMHHFIYDGVDSRELELLVSGEKTYNAPSRDVTNISIPGRSGDLYIDNGRYTNAEISYTCHLSNDILNKIKYLKAWLSSKVGYRKLEDSYDPDYFRLAAYHNALEFEVSLNRFATFELLFDCDPFKYLKQGEQTVTFTKSGSTIYNPELFESRPIITVYGTGSCILTINNVNYNLSNIDQYVTINSVTYSVYKDTVNKNSTINFLDFPVLQSGYNIVDFTGAINKIEIIPRWCTL